MNAAPIATLIGHQSRRHRVSLTVMAAGLWLFHFLITRIAPAPDEVNWMSQIFAAVPPRLLALAGRDVGDPTSAGFLALGYGHPFMLLALGAWTVRASCGALAGEIDRGTMDLLAARPVARWHHVVAAALVTWGGGALLATAAVMGSAIGLHLRPLGVTIALVARVGAMAWMLFAAWGGIGLVISALHRDGGAATAWLTGIMAVSFVLEYVSRLWHPLARLHAWSLFTYFDPQQIVRAVGTSHSDVTPLAVTAIAGFALAVVLFARRDL